jgi:hypothetical protein
MEPFPCFGKCWISVFPALLSAFQSNDPGQGSQGSHHKDHKDQGAQGVISAYSGGGLHHSNLESPKKRRQVQPGTPGAAHSS